MTNAVVCLFVLILSGAISAEAKLKKVPTRATATEVEPPIQETANTPGDDAFYRLRRLFLFPGLDDLNGVIATRLDKKMASIVGANPRFELISDTSVIKALNPDDKEYRKIAGSEAVHREAAQAANADATLLVKNKNVGNKLELSLEWRDSLGAPVIVETLSLPGFSSLEAQENALEKIFAACVTKIPFHGTVTGRKEQTLTIDLGENQIQVGDIITLGRFASALRHPLLKTLVKADFVKVGSARVVTVDRVLSFAEITEESNNEYIGPNHKIISIQRRELAPAVKPKQVPVLHRDTKFSRDENERPAQNKLFGDEDERDSQRLKGDFDRPKARLGNIGAGAAIGSISHTNTTGNVNTDVSGTGIGAFVAGEFWMTKEWSVSADYHFQSATLAGSSGSSGNTITVGSSSWKRLAVWGAYRYFPVSDRLDEEGTVISFGAGYDAKNASVAANSASNTSPAKYSGILLRVDGEIAIMPNSRLLAGLSLVPFGSAAGLQSVTSLGFRVGWGFLLQDTLWARISFDYDSVSGTLANGTDSRTDKRYAILPAVYFYF